MKFKCRKRKKPSKHNEEKRMTQATEAEKEMGMEHKYWRANWIFICGTQKVQMRAGMGARGVAPPYRVRSCVFFFFFYFCSRGAQHFTMPPWTLHSHRETLILAPSTVLFYGGWWWATAFLLFMFDRFSCWYVKHADSQWLQLLYSWT